MMETFVMGHFQALFLYFCLICTYAANSWQKTLLQGTLFVKYKKSNFLLMFKTIGRIYCENVPIIDE